MSDINEVRDGVIRQFREQQQKFAYYLIALCVAGIGFAIQRMAGVALSQTQIPLGIGVLCLAVSIYCGFEFIGHMTHALFLNFTLLDVIAGREKLAGTHPEKIKIGVETIETIIEKKSNKAMFLAKWQSRLFYIGVIGFLVWQILEMYIMTKK